MREKPGDDIWQSLCGVQQPELKAGSAEEQHCGSDRNLKGHSRAPEIPMDLASACAGPELMGCPLPSLLSKQAEPADRHSVSRKSASSL